MTDYRTPDDIKKTEATYGFVGATPGMINWNAGRPEDITQPAVLTPRDLQRQLRSVRYTLDRLRQAAANMHLTSHERQQLTDTINGIRAQLNALQGT
jgi:hypothetical protein